MPTSAKKYLPINDEGVAAAYERVLLDISQQEAAILSLLLGVTPASAPGLELSEALYDVVGYSHRDEVRTAASRSLPLANIGNPHVLAYLGQFPGD